MKTLPVYAEVDIVVCGGGTAGAFAAIAAAEQGKSVLLIEQFGSLGGTATNGLVTPVMHSKIEGNPQSSYIQKKLVQRLKKYGACNEAGDKFDPLVLRVALEELCAEAGVRLLYHTYLVGAETEDGVVTAVRVANKAGEQLVKATVFIDATGDGDVSVMCGADYTKGNPETGRCQPMSLRYVVSGIDIPAAGEFLLEQQAKNGRSGVIFDRNDPYNSIYAGGFGNRPWVLTEWLEAGVESGELTVNDKEYWQFFSIPGRKDSLAFNCPEFFERIDSTNPDDLTLAQVEGKKAIFRQLLFYRRHFPGFENAYVSEIASMVGARESRQIITEHVLSEEDVMLHRKFEDGFCQSNYPVDVHGRSPRYASESIKWDGDQPWYDIPFRSLVVKGFDNLLVVGRCFGAEFIAQSSTRVQHSCRSSGEAAGIAAAMAVDAGVPVCKIAGKTVRETMISLGAEYRQ